MQFEEKTGTMWLVPLERESKPYKLVFLSTPTAEEAQARVQAVFGNKGEKALPAKAALYAMADPALKITEFTWVPKKQI
jgi:hypothetical protein